MQVHSYTTLLVAFNHSSSKKGLSSVVEKPLYTELQTFQLLPDLENIKLIVLWISKDLQGISRLCKDYGSSQLLCISNIDHVLASGHDVVDGVTIYYHTLDPFNHN